MLAVTTALSAYANRVVFVGPEISHINVAASRSRVKSRCPADENVRPAGGHRASGPIANERVVTARCRNTAGLIANIGVLGGVGASLPSCSANENVGVTGRVGRAGVRSYKGIVAG